MNRIFDIKRFWLMLRWDVLTYWKKLTSMTLGLALGLGFAYIGILMSLKGGMNDANPWADMATSQYMDSAITSTIIAFFVFIGVGASTIFGNMKTKENRVAFLIQPASNLEKYIVRLLHVTVLFYLCFVAAVLIADLLQFVYSLVVTPGYHVSIAWRLSQYPHWIGAYLGGMDFSEAWLIVAILLWGHSLYLLGGAFFRRRAWLFTTALHFIIGLAFMSAGISYASDMASRVNINGETFTQEEAMTGVAVVCIVFHAITIFNYWASYKLFTRMQVVNNKWINM